MSAASTPLLASLLDPGLVSRLLGRAMQRGGTFAEVYAQRRRTFGLDLDDGQVRSASSAAEFGVGIRVISGSSVAYAYSDDVSDESLFECADAASHVGGRDSFITIAKPLSPRRRPHHADAADRPSQAEIADRVRLLLRADEAVRGELRDTPHPLDQVAGSYADVDEDVLIANSEGLWVTDQRALCRMSLEVVVRDSNGERRVGTGGGGSRLGLASFVEVTPEHIAREASRMALAQLGARPAPAGEHVVVVGPSSSGVLLHEAVGHGLEADFIRKKTSLFAGRLGQKVASELCTVVDDGTLPGRRGSLNVDDEGTATTRSVLVERGVLRAYMSDKLNATLMGIEPTGNGRRQSFRHAPLPRMTNTFLLGGKDDPEDIVKEVNNGIYCRAFGGGQVDIANGNFVFEVREGYLIEDGKITAPVKGASLVGSGPDVLQKISRVGHDQALDPGIYTCGKDGQSVPVCVGFPTVRIDAITVGGTGA